MSLLVLLMLQAPEEFFGVCIDQSAVSVGEPAEELVNGGNLFLYGRQGVHGLAELGRADQTLGTS
jgi:hypothetical protein